MNYDITSVLSMHVWKYLLRIWLEKKFLSKPMQSTQQNVMILIRANSRGWIRQVNKDWFHNNEISPDFTQKSSRILEFYSPYLTI